MDTKQNIKAILFDFAGVIGTDAHWILMSEIVPKLEEKREYIQKIDDKVDRGEISNTEYSRLLSEYTGIPPENNKAETFKRLVINQEVVEYIKKLKQKYKIGLFSNYTYEWLEEIIKKYNLAECFNSIYISSHYGMIKPEPGAFNKAVELLGVGKDEMVFIDDRQRHIDAAKALGIAAVLYTTVDQLKKDLENLGVMYGSN